VGFRNRIVAVTTPQFGRSGFRLPARAELLSSPNHLDRLLGPPNLTFNGYLGSFPVVQRTVREVDNPHPSNAEIKNEWSLTSASPLCLYGVDRGNFTYTF
jgi:hypothetical protein